MDELSWIGSKKMEHGQLDISAVRLVLERFPAAEMTFLGNGTVR